MPLPVVPILFGLGRALSVALRNWQGLLAVTGLVAATSFSFAHLLSEAGETARSLWPILAIACFFWLAKEVVRAHFKLQNRKLKKGADK